MMHLRKVVGSLALASCLLAGCRPHGGAELRIGVTPGPAEEVLDAVKDDLAKEGVTLKVVPFTDYMQPDMALAGNDLDANLYQNVPFLEQFNHDHGSHILPVASVYVPLMAIYAGKTKSLQSLASGAKVALPNDPVNRGRALVLLQTAGLLTLTANAGAHASTSDVAANPHQLQLVELDASQLPRSRQDVDLAVINANFALDAGLDPMHDSVFREQPDPHYANVLAATAEHQTDARLQKLATALRSSNARGFISAHYKGAILPAS